MEVFISFCRHSFFPGMLLHKLATHVGSIAVCAQTPVLDWEGRKDRKEAAVGVASQNPLNDIAAVLKTGHLFYKGG